MDTIKRDYLHNIVLYGGYLRGIDLIKNIDDFNENQLQEIKEGLERGLNVSIYAKPEFNEHQMEQIKLGLMMKVDVSLYNETFFNSQQMRDIRIELSFPSEFDYSEITSEWFDKTFSSFNKEQKKEILLGMEDKVNISVYAYKEVPASHMKQIRLTLKNKIINIKIKKYLSNLKKGDILNPKEFINYCDENIYNTYNILKKLENEGVIYSFFELTCNNNYKKRYSLLDILEMNIDKECKIAVKYDVLKDISMDKIQILFKEMEV